MNITIKKPWAEDKTLSVLDAVEEEIANHDAPGEMETLRMELNRMSTMLATLVDILADSETINLKDVQAILNEYEVTKGEA